jgi:hypothetical protein
MRALARALAPELAGDTEALTQLPDFEELEVAVSLLKAWPRLVRWQTQDEEGAVLRDQLKQAAHLWEEKGRTPDLLWTGTAFQEYVRPVAGTIPGRADRVVRERGACGAARRTRSRTWASPPL